MNSSSKHLRADIVCRAKWALIGNITMPTRELAQHIADQIGQPSKAVSTILQDAASYELAAYATRGDGVLCDRGYNKGRMVHPWNWHPKKDRPELAKPADRLDTLLAANEKTQALLATMLVRLSRIADQIGVDGLDDMDEADEITLENILGDEFPAAS